MLLRIHNRLPGAGCVLLISRGFDDKIWLIIVGMLGDMPWGTSVPFV